MTQPCTNRVTEDIAPPARPLLFEALSTPPRGLSRGAILRIGLLLGGAAPICGGGFVWLGAWPVFGFLGVEVLLVVALLSAHARWSSRAFERVLLADGRLTIERDNGRGQREKAEMDAYWARPRWIETAPGEGRLLITLRGRGVEIGMFLNGPERRSLHDALDRALIAWRNPTFENTQLMVAIDRAKSPEAIRPGPSPG
ncbi:DUF2244 domain-containing protein [Humitalea sp. 24SJ18S-53]|uniref:DUF2244 domain-containing protein n=1 Tax=Humitalea sp. 24SJ18S-53 TaxID=3422307 RepID=UPI003D676016